MLTQTHSFPPPNMFRFTLSLLFFLALATPVFCQEYWQLFFQPDGSVQHEALLRKSSSGTWVMRVRFYSARCSCYDVIEQRMKKENTSKGYRLAGYNPVKANTDVEHDSYIADNIYFEENSDGDMYVTNRDDSGTETAVTGIRSITDTGELRRLLTKFKW
jgi:hypothetical protein